MEIEVNTGLLKLDKDSFYLYCYLLFREIPVSYKSLLKNLPLGKDRVKKSILFLYENKFIYTSSGTGENSCFKPYQLKKEGSHFTFSIKNLKRYNPETLKVYCAIFLLREMDDCSRKRLLRVSKVKASIVDKSLSFLFWKYKITQDEYKEFSSSYELKKTEYGQISYLKKKSKKVINNNTHLNNRN